ncbi:L,D-transpeptidase [Mangrovibacterium lignilyticum]|uniref:L,D-transpeptidase n=1 Tax=Mangrovibacterium lignilyticum TaxID=2668052 RepID=UPI0013D84F0C|nr:L,D-transpeptidase [Mangrovibacterium lignilyticum]
MNEDVKTKNKVNKIGFLKNPLWGWLGFVTVILTAILLFLWLLFSFVPWLKDQAVFYKVNQPVNDSVVENRPTDKDLTDDIGRLQKKLERMTPGGVYLIINTSDNSFSLYQNKQLIREGLCSTGSYIKLQAENQKNWVFETPKGVFTIKGKITNPVWRKPDWAFVEEGLPIPSANDPSRYESGVLGAYALSLGGGYLIHGTLYKRFLGQAVTHGCVRMNDEDLETVYKTLSVGAKVFIY